MLCQFSVENFRCIKDKITLNMQAAPIKDGAENLLLDKDGEKFLPITVIYGPNGGGKSTVLDAIYCLFDKIMRPILTIARPKIVGKKIRREVAIIPYKFDIKTLNSPTKFEIFFRTKEREYQYNLSVFNENILQESLYYKEIIEADYHKVFERKVNHNNNSEIDLSDSLKQYEIKDITDSLPLLSYFAIMNDKQEIISDAVGWFSRYLFFLDYKRRDIEYYMGVPEKKEDKKLLLDMLQEMGIDIVDYHVEKVQESNRIKIYTVHEVNGKRYELNLHDESSGTEKIFNSLPEIIRILKRGGTIIADELDAKLHPILLQYLISLFKQDNINKHKAQLIFTSQDIMTMTSDNFRRDEIWFAAKNMNQEAQLYSLVEFKEDESDDKENYNKLYMKGKYGADPFLHKMLNEVGTRW